MTFTQLMSALGEEDLQKVVSRDLVTQLVCPDQELARVPSGDIEAGVNIYGKPLTSESGKKPQLVAGGGDSRRG